jgi:hypothetical protein
MTHEFLDPERHRDPAIGPRAVDPVRLHPPGSTAAGCQCGRPPGLSASRRRDVPGGLGARRRGRRPGLARRWHCGRYRSAMNGMRCICCAPGPTASSGLPRRSATPTARPCVTAPAQARARGARIELARLSRRAASPARARFVTLAPVRSLPRRPSVNSDERRAQGPIDSFAWQYSFYAYLIYRQAPATQEQLADLAQALHIMKGRGITPSRRPTKSCSPGRSK